MAKSIWDVLDRAGQVLEARESKDLEREIALARLNQERTSQAVTYKTNPMAVKMQLPDANAVLKSPLFIFSAILLLITVVGRETAKG